MLLGRAEKSEGVVVGAWVGGLVVLSSWGLEVVEMDHKVGGSVYAGLMV
jgi:hypothetical protein